MNSDDYFDDELDSGILSQLDIIEATHRPHVTSHPKQAPARQPVPTQKLRTLEADDSFDLTLDLDEADLERLDSFIKDAYQGKAKPVAGPSNPPRASAPKSSIQTTLFGGVLQSTPSSSNHGSASRSPAKSNPRHPFGQQAPKTKQWDHTAFAKSGWKKPRSSKGKGKAENGDQEEEDVEFEQFPAPFVSVGPPPPMKPKVDMLEAKHWIYPLNQPKRDYQLNIVKNCLFDNTLVALPTGLGKTFIAGVVMLNYYRWFPDGKVVFVAPTKPLVAQQIDACHQTCGISGRDAVELTGNNPRAYRSRMWEEKRVFYMTPQTLMNDLTTDNCDPRDIVLMVIDEAHKGTGDYAYAQVIRYMMAKNPHFRVLALTATPGSSPEAIQAIVDSLHISRIEIRDEGSLDLRDYMHKKAGRGDCALSKLGAMARAMGYLMEASAGMCLSSLQQFVAEKEKSGDDNKASKNALRNDATFRELLSQLSAHKARPGGFAMHPKMETLKLLLVQHFGSRMAEGAEGDGPGEDTKAMVFVTFRECVDEIVDVLNEERPLLRATRFVGQAADKQGRKGFAQKEQLEVIKKFKAGEFNVLVSTSIGEEGLDIGEVDMIICYDAQKTPIRMLQRVGRTGRKRDGYVHVLLSEIREELNWDKAQDTYGELQKCIVRGDQLELYGDVPRLLPDHLRPQVLEKKMDIVEYVREDTAKKKPSHGVQDGASPVKGKKRKRNDDVDRNIPPGASKDFVSVADLLVKKKKTKTRKFDDTLADDDSTDRELEANLLDTGRSASTSVALERSSKKKGPLRKTRTTDPERRQVTESARKKGETKEKELLTASQLFCKGNDDPDMDIELSIMRDDISSIPSTSRESLVYRISSSPDRPVTSTSRLQPERSASAIVPAEAALPRHSPPCPSHTPRSRSATLDDPVVFPNPTTPSIWSSSPKVVGHEVIELTSSPSPPAHSHMLNDSPAVEQDGKETFVHQSGFSPTHAVDNDDAGQDISWLLDEDDDLDINIVSSSPAVPRIAQNPYLVRPENNSVVEINGCGVSPSQWSEHSSAAEMLPPVIPNRSGQTSPLGSFDLEIPEASFAVRPAGKRPPRKQSKPLGNTCLSSPSVASPAHHRLVRRETEVIPRPTTPALRPKKRKKPIISIRHNPWLDGEAEHSGDEVSGGSSHSEDDVESESDRQFLKDIPDTQISPSYDQCNIYRQSLLTQPSGRQDLPVFANKPFRRGGFTTASEYTRRRPMVSSSPPTENDEPDEYVFGSFVVADDADLSFE
ncbi:hypothetical protein ID866_4160 [Astraeus odoratus]|nr:hypothetical protein ID866_4160 [Astraeus odoratus]